MNEELKVIIKAELAQFRQAMSSAISSLKSVRTESQNASKETKHLSQAYGELSGKINQQTSRVRALKEQYVDAYIQYGKNSKEALNLAKSIGKLTTKLEDNKEAYEEAMKAADKYDASVIKADKTKAGNQVVDATTSAKVDATTDSVDKLQGSLQAIASLKVGDMLLDIFDEKLVGKIKKITREIDKAKTEFSEATTYLGRALQSFNKNSGIYTEEGEKWSGIGGAFKGAADEIKSAASTSAKGWKHMFSAVSTTAKTAFASIKTFVTSTLGAITIALGIVAGVVVSIIALTKNALNTAQNLTKELHTAAKVGMNVSEYREWGYILKQVGIESEKIVDFNKKMAEQQNQVRSGSEDIANAFARIGISAEEVQSLNQSELFAKTVEGLQNIESETERTSLAYKLFSDDAKELNNLLYLNNEETQSLISNYYALGGAPSENLVAKSQQLTQVTTNLSYAWEGLKNALAEWVLPAVITVVKWLTNCIAVLNVFLSGIFQIKTTTAKADNWAKPGNAMKKSFDGATKSAKELQRYTMGFDELNIVQKPTDTSSSGNSSTAGDYGSMSGYDLNIPTIPVPDLTGLREFMDEYGSLIQGILTWIGIAAGIGLVIAGVMTGNIPMIVGGIAACGLGIAIGAAGGEESHWAKLGEGIANAFTTAIGGIRAFLTGMVEGLGVALGWTYDNFLAPIREGFKWCFDGICEVFAPLGNWFGELFSSIKATLVTSWEAFSGLAKGCWDATTHVWGICSNWFSENVASPVGKFFSGMWEGVKTGASKAWEGIKSVFTPVAEWFSNVFSKAWQGVKNIFSTGGKIFMGIVDGIAKVFTTVVNGIIKGINAVIAVPFKAINGVLNTVRDVSVAGIKPFEKYINKNHLAIPQIPELAHGGVVTGDTLARIGEQGYREVVLPLERNTDWMDVLIDRMNGRNNAPTKIVLNVDGKELGYAAINSINGITKQTGSLGLILV